jgi:hypothetical protein
MFKVHPIWGVSLLVALGPVQSPAGVLVEDSQLGFSLWLPDEFERVPEEEKPTDFVRVYRQSGVEGQLNVIVAVERLHGVILREDLKADAANRALEMTTERWKEFDISVARVSEEINGVPAVVLNAQVPLNPEAIQLKLIGPEPQEVQIRQLLRDTLATLDGSTNWLTADERTQLLYQGSRRLGLTVALLSVIVILLLFAMKELRRRIWRRS